MSENKARIFKSDASHAITLPDSIIEELNLKPGDVLIQEVHNDQIILKKESHRNFSEEWKQFFEQGGSYEDYETHQWGEASEREKW
ncbi:AbrB/MazE/SpoVT family DNA-binding domain-containing protein [Staphylococcus debuckii]|uniref:AbrB/MazE/SpoVT family DNA-binding domain-containing protein n=1 Tax=Staphylococcus debuckii TaxID=2044912 RepID=A0ABU9EUG5_9STAP